MTTLTGMLQSSTQNSVQLASSSRSSFVGQCLPTLQRTPTQICNRTCVKVAAKGKTMMRRGMGRAPQPQLPPTPPVDPENVEFVVFVRSKKLPKWVPLSIIKGGTSANVLVKSLESDWGNKMFKGQLVNNIGAALYKDKVAVERSIRQQFPPLKAVKEFEYGFKIRNKEDPSKWWVPEEVMMIPPEEEINTQGALQKAAEGAKDFFDSGFKNMSTALKGLTPSATK